MARRSVWLNPNEQAVLDQVRARLIEPQEEARQDELIPTRNYLKSAALVGNNSATWPNSTANGWFQPVPTAEMPDFLRVKACLRQTMN